MSELPRVMVGGPIRDREWSVPLWLGGLLDTTYPRELLSLVVVVNDSKDRTYDACRWWADRALSEGWARAEVLTHDLGTAVDNNARQADRQYKPYAQLRDFWSALRGPDDLYLYSVDSDIQAPRWLLQALVGFAARDDYALLAAVIENNWAPAQQHHTNVMVLDQDGQTHHSKLAYASREMQPRPCVLTGACCVLHRRVFDAGISYVDEAAKVHPPEDNIFCQRLLKAGQKIGYVPGLRASHWHRPPADTEYLSRAEWWARQADYAAHMAEVTPAVGAV